jgi:tetratricopeptide (TPR) repeat protein
LARLEDLSILPVPKALLDFYFEREQRDDLLEIEEVWSAEDLAFLTEDEINALSGLVASGRDLYSRGDYSGAVQKYNQALKLAPHIASLYFERGQVHLALGDAKQPWMISMRLFDCCRS